MDWAIRRACPAHLPQLAAIEQAAATVFPAGFLPETALSDSVPLPILEAASAQGLLLVALENEIPVGFALLRSTDDLALLAELDVHPDRARRGIGRRLVAEAEAVMRSRGHEALFLTTFAHVPWNAPWYARLGFTLLPETETPALLRDILQNERARGLEDRVAMHKTLR